MTRTKTSNLTLSPWDAIRNNSENAVVETKIHKSRQFSLSLSLSLSLCLPVLSVSLSVCVCLSVSLSVHPHRITTQQHNSSPHNIQVLPQSSKHMGSQGSSESCATTNNNTKCEKTRRKLENNTNTPASAATTRTSRNNKREDTHGDRQPSGQASKQKGPAVPCGSADCFFCRYK